MPAYMEDVRHESKERSKKRDQYKNFHHIKDTSQIYSVEEDSLHMYLNTGVEGLPDKMTKGEPSMNIGERAMLGN